jgi:tetratricopeptide (TPR) repeat protein
MPDGGVAKPATRSGAGRREWLSWLLRVGLPSAGLLVLVSLVPSEAIWARSAAQVGAVVIPLGIELVRRRWSDKAEKRRKIASLRAMLEPLSVDAPEHLRMGLDDPAFRVSSFWGRAQDMVSLYGARSQLPGGGLVLVTGPAWVGKTRLLIEWALDLPPETVAGWLRSGTAEATIDAARALDQPVVLLQQGSDDDTVAALNALAGGPSRVLLVVEKRDASHLSRSARKASPGARRLAEAALEVTVSNPGSPSDMEFRYGQMFLAYRQVSGGAARSRPHSSIPWTSEPIGLVSSLAMMAALGLVPASERSHLSAFQHYWAELIEPWLQRRPDQSFGLPPLSDTQLETALTVGMLSGDTNAAALHQLKVFQDLSEHHRDQLARWAVSVTGVARSASAQLAVVAAAEAWNEADRDPLSAALRASPAAGLGRAIGACVNAEQMLHQPLATTRSLVAADLSSITVTLDALGGEQATHLVDLLLPQRVEEAGLDHSDAVWLLTHPETGRYHFARSALLQRQFVTLPPDTPSLERAELAYELSLSSSKVGHHKEALEPAEEAVRLFRQLAPSMAGDDEDALASSLFALASLLFELGRADDAVVAVRESVTLYRQLLEDSPGNLALYRPSLASALRGLALYLSEGVNPIEALEPLQEAVRLNRELADPKTGDPAEFAPELATSLTNLAVLYSHLGRTDEGFEVCEEAVALYLELTNPASSDPLRHRPGLAASLNNLSLSMGALGRTEESLEPALLSLHIRRELADPTVGNPDLYNPGLSSSLANIATALGTLGRTDEAIKSTQEAVALNRKLADPTTGNLDRYSTQLGQSLTNLAALLAENGHIYEALKPAQEAVDLNRMLADPKTGSPDRYEPDFAASLSNLAFCLNKLGRAGDALKAAQEAVVLYRRLSDPSTGNPQRYDPDFATSLSNLAHLMAGMGYVGDALKAAQEAVGLILRLADPATGHPDRYATQLKEAEALESRLLVASEGRPEACSARNAAPAAAD